MKKTIWIIEDLSELQSIYESLLAKDYNICFFQSAKDFANAYKNIGPNEKVDLLLIDLMLIDGHFFKICNDLDITINNPFIVISSHDDIENMESAFQAGAIDYILKPLNFNEIKIKIKRHLQLIDEAENKLATSIHGLKLDLEKFTNKECKILEHFMKNPEQILNRQEITELLWDKNVNPNTLDVHIFNLRRKLKEFNYSISSIKNGNFKLHQL